MNDAPDPDTAPLALFDAAGPALPVGVLGLTGDITPADALAALPRLRRFGAAWRWVVGDLVLALVDRDPARLHEAWQQIGDLDLDDRPSLMKSVAVALQVAPERRRAALSWSHHAAVAGLGADEQETWLGVAEDRGLTVGALTDAIAGDEDEDDAPPLFDPPPRPWAQRHAAALAELDKAFSEDPARPVVVFADGRTLVPNGAVADALAGL